jgi:transcriptional regulator with XRE-family HTH domain
LGANLRTARLRRGLSAQEVAERIGVDRRSVADAEKGKPSTSVAVYAAALWALGLIEQLAPVADPATDREGIALATQREPKRAPAREAFDNDF